MGRLLQISQDFRYETNLSHYIGYRNLMSRTN